ncbi:MAG: hypothetical protein FWF50_05630 [Defluviitaleaceae bacterium]|nr:hypothetical protein [Defluviitaleaceae bacterium]
MENLANQLERIDSKANSIISSIERDIQKKSSLLEAKLQNEKRTILETQKRAHAELQKEVYTELQKELKELEKLYNEKRREIQNFDIENITSELFKSILENN